MEKSIPLNLDLTCLEINSSLEDSLATASSILSLVKTVEPNIITIQCLVTEESLDYLLFKKLPPNNYDKKFTKSSDINKQANSCVAWKVIASILKEDTLSLILILDLYILCHSCRLGPYSSSFPANKCG